MTDAPAWAKGQDMAFLKECAALYRAEFKPHSYGAFGVPKERDIADALADDSLMWTRRPDGLAAAVARVVSRPQPHEDFAGRRAMMMKGDVFVKSLAGPVGGKRRLLSAIDIGSPSLWVEAHVENAETVALLAESGAVHVLTKVAASSDLKGLFLIGSTEGRLPEPLAPADAAALKILRPAFLSPEDLAAIGAELAAHLAHAPEAFAQHYSGYNKRQSWTAFALRGYDHDDPGFIIKPSEMSKGWKEENAARLQAGCNHTTAAPVFDATWKILGRIPGDFQRVRFMRLAGAGGELTRHADITDPEAGTKDGQIARLHIPIVTDPRCLFRSWALDGQEHRMHMPVGSLCYLDTRKPHAVINPAEVERIHLVVDVHATPELRERIGA